MNCRMRSCTDTGGFAGGELANWGAGTRAATWCWETCCLGMGDIPKLKAGCGVSSPPSMTWP